MTRSRLAIATLLLLVLYVLLTMPSTAQSPSLLFLSGSAGPAPANAVSLAAYLPASTTTARNAAGTLQAEKSSRWSVVSFPAANSQATASIAAEAAVRHVADCVTWSADASAAVTAAAGNLAVRDGATGAGTIIWQAAIAHLVAAGAGVQTIAPHTVCGLNLVGTTNTAMTAEFNAGVTGEVQAVSLSGYNVN